MSQETRNYIYGIVIAAIPLIVAAGYIAPGEAEQWTNLAAAILGLSTTALAKPNANPKKVTVVPKGDGKYRAAHPLD